jgi:broad specificity phosphatase PhoE
MIYLLTEPPNTLEAKGRVLGNYPAHWTSASKKMLHEICMPLKDKGVKFVYFSDLDADAGCIVASELNVPFQREHGLRRFNCGRHHGGKLDYFQGILEQLIPKWRDNDSIPIRGGDSWVSVEKRLFKTVSRILAKEETSVIVTDARTGTLIQFQEPRALIMNGTGCKPGRIYIVKKPGTGAPCQAQ